MCLMLVCLARTIWGGKVWQTFRTGIVQDWLRKKQQPKIHDGRQTHVFIANNNNHENNICSALTSLQFCQIS